MKNVLTILAISLLFAACSKKEAHSTQNETDSNQIIDSINALRTKINDSIRTVNNKNRFKDFSGVHKFTHNSIKNPGSVDFKKTGRDEYEISGKIKSGKDYATIKGTAITVSPKYINFTGDITQSISGNDNGKPYIRRGTITFMSKDGGKTWRLQDMVNGSGFADYIDIHF